MVKSVYRNNGHEKRRMHGHADNRNNGLFVKTALLGVESAVNHATNWRQRRQKKKKNASVQKYEMITTKIF